MKKKPEFVLCKHPVQADTRGIVRYLRDVHRFDAGARLCIERNHPSWAPELPTILDVSTEVVYVGLERCIEFYEMISGVRGLAQKCEYERPPPVPLVLSYDVGADE
jgi:hypothetical protein